MVLFTPHSKLANALTQNNKTLHGQTSDTHQECLCKTLGYWTQLYGYALNTSLSVTSEIQMDF